MNRVFVIWAGIPLAAFFGIWVAHVRRTDPAVGAFAGIVIYAAAGLVLLGAALATGVIQ